MLVKIARAVLIAGIILVLFIPAVSVLAAVPIISTDAASSESESSAVLNGTILDLGTFAGPNVYLYFEYCTDAHYDDYGSYDKETAEQTWPIADGLTTFNATLTGLPNSTEYHYRAALRYGTSYVYGVDQTFNSAMLPPDSVPDIHVLKAYQDLLEADDCLFVILADISYGTIPSIPVSRAFKWALTHSGDEVGWNIGYAMNDNGYGFNVYSLYFTAASAIEWGNTTDYEVQLSGSPAVFSITIPVYDAGDSGDYVVGADTWVVSSDYPKTLAVDVLKIARTLEQEWQVVLLDEQDTKTVLSSNGEKLFRNAIPNIQAMAPSLFYVRYSGADVSDRTWGTSLDDYYKERLLGADGVPGGGDDTWIATSFIGLADWINVPYLLMIGLTCISCCVYVIWQSNKRYGTPLPGYVGALLIVFCFSMLALGLTIAAIIAMAIVIGTGWLLFMRKA